MAALSHTKTTPMIQMGDRVMQSFRITAVGTAAADEWIATGFSKIDAVIGVVLHGADGGAETPNFVLNAQGTANTEGAEPGDLGIEILDAATNDVEVTVIGIR